MNNQPAGKSGNLEVADVEPVVKHRIISPVSELSSLRSVQEPSLDYNIIGASMSRRDLQPTVANLSIEVKFRVCVC